MAFYDCKAENIITIKINIAFILRWKRFYPDFDSKKQKRAVNPL
jgi:hypothetical protein